MLFKMSRSTALNTRDFGKRLLAVLMVIFFSISVRAYSWYGGAWNGGWGYWCNGSGYWNNGGWCGTGIPNGLGWTLFGLEAASAIALPTAIVDSELSSSPCYNFDGNLNFDYASYCDPYVAYGDESPYVLSTPWPLVIGVGYPIYPLSGWGYGWGGSSGYCYNGWHGYRGYDYRSGCDYYSTGLRAAGGVAYSKGNSYYSGTTVAGHGNFHSRSTLAEAEQNYHARSGSLDAQTGTPDNRQALAMSSKGNDKNAGILGGVRTHGVTDSAATGSVHSRSTLAEAEQTYNPPLASSQLENVSKSHWNASRIALPNITDGKTTASSASSEHIAEAHPGFSGIDPTAHMQSTGSNKRTANEVSSSSGGGFAAPQRFPAAQSFSEGSPHGMRSPSTIRQERPSSSGLSSREQITSAGREALPASNHMSSRGASTSINREVGLSKPPAGVVAPTSSHRVATSGVAQRPTQLQHSSTGSGTIGSHSLKDGGGLTDAIH